MRVTALGHAGLQIDTTEAVVLVDPWFSPEGAFQASWFQFPDNSHLLSSLPTPTAIVISHEHLDHVDPWFLARVPSSVPVIVPRYPSPVLLGKIRSAGQRPIVEAEPWDEVEIARGTRVFFVSEASPMNHDSAIVITGDGRTLLNLNDARLSPVQFRGIKQKVGGRVDVFTFQGAGASWYPMSYRYPDDRKRELSTQKRLAKFSYVASSIRLLDPVVSIPFAGPPCFLDPELFRHNREMEHGIFPDQQQVAAWLADRSIDDTVVLLPGDAWDTEARVKDHDPIWDDFSFSERWGYLEEYAVRRRADVERVLARYAEPTESLWEPFREHFEHLLAMSPYFNAKIGMRVAFDISGPGGGHWSVDFRPGLEGVFATDGPAGYRYAFASRWLPPILRGEVPWEDFFLSVRFEAERTPDLYSDHLLGLLKFAEPEALDAVESFETSMRFDERVTVHAEGRSYSVARYCPHAGNDLQETGEVLPGRVLRCLAHHYEFSLDTGRCLNGTGLELDVEQLDEAAADSRVGRRHT
jgi:UDP-MurNAc hydroxylase